MVNCFASSPNWFLSQCCDVSSENFFCYGSKNLLVIYKIISSECTEKSVFEFCQSIEAHSERITGVCVVETDKEQLCSTSSDDGKARVWNLRTFELVKEFSANEIVDGEEKFFKATTIHASTINHDLILVANERGSFFRWNFVDDRSKKYSPLHDSRKEKKNHPVTAIACSNYSEEIAAVGYQEGFILVYDLSGTGSVLHKLRGHDDEIQSLHWRPSLSNHVDDTPYLASGARDAHIRIWDVAKGMEDMSFRLPTNSKKGDGERSVLWSAVRWLPGKPYELLTGGYHGELLFWNLPLKSHDKGKPKCTVVNSGNSGHSRVIMNICPAKSGYDIEGKDRPLQYALTIGQDRNIIAWDLDNMEIRSMLFTFGGFIYSIEVSPLDPTLVALGSGDQNIRIWRQSPGDPVTILWHGIKGKVTCLNWHPLKEGILAYGTDDGRVGSFDINKCGKPPIISTTYHRKTVYTVQWGPKCYRGDNAKKIDPNFLYSVGDGLIFQHELMSKERAQNLNDIISKTNEVQAKPPLRTAFSWNHNYSLAVIGSEDGSIGVYSYPHLQAILNLQGHIKLINCLVWQSPLQQQEQVTNTNQYRLGGTVLATGGNDNKLCIFDLDKSLDCEETKTCSLVYPTKVFGQHKGRITAVKWSPHISNLLVTASYDGSAQIWDIKSEDKVLKSNFRGHLGRLLSLAWSGSDPNLLHSGGDDGLLWTWNVADTDHQEPPSENKFEKRMQENKRKAKELRRKGKKASQITESTEPCIEILSCSKTDSVPDFFSTKNRSEMFSENLGDLDCPKDDLVVEDEIQKLLQSKEKELKTVLSTPENPDGNQEKSEIFETKSTSSLTNARRKLFRNCIGSFSASPCENQLSSLINLAYFKRPDLRDNDSFSFNVGDNSQNGTPETAEHLVENHPITGAFSNRSGMLSLINKEREALDNKDGDDNFQLDFLQGNIGKALDDAIKSRNLTDWMVSMTIMCSPFLRQKACIAFADQLVHPVTNASPDPKKASYYLLACNMVYEAIQLLEEFKLFREAICISKIRLREDDPILNRLYISWANFLSRSGQFIQAAHCYVACNEFRLASIELFKSKDDKFISIAERFRTLEMTNDL